MSQRVQVLFAVRDKRMTDSLCMEIDDEEHCAVTVVTDGHAALLYAERTIPQVLVIDSVLPGMDGLRTADCMRAALGRKMPRVIAGSEMEFADRAWQARGASCVLRVPWRLNQLRDAVLREIQAVLSEVDWNRIQALSVQALTILEQMGINGRLKGSVYLAHAAALAYDQESRLNAVGKSLYHPIADHFAVSPESVERLIRHAVESAMDTIGAQGLYRFFGNTIDPMRGKPTNAQMIALLAERMRVEKSNAI